MNIERFTNDTYAKRPNSHKGIPGGYTISNTQPAVSTNKKISTFFLNAKQFGNTPSEDPLIYYKELCAEFPNTSFRLSDIEEDKNKQVSFGYGGSMNQVGEDFGELGRCSIEIDVSVIRKMQNDPQYAERVKHLIRYTEGNTSQRAYDAAKEGMLHTAVSIYEENGELSTSIGMSRAPYSTEEEIRRMWNMDATQNLLNSTFSIARGKLMDEFLEMTGKNETEKTDSNLSEK